MAKSLTDLELIHELEPIAEVGLNQHLASTRNWNPHDYVPWSHGSNYASLGGQECDTEQSRLSDVARVAMVTNLLQAPLLVLLTVVDGLYSADPGCDPSAELVTTVPAIDRSVLEKAGSSQCSKPRKFSRNAVHSFGTPSQPAKMLPMASIVSGPVMETGDSWM